MLQLMAKQRLKGWNWGMGFVPETAAHDPTRMIISFGHKQVVLIYHTRPNSQIRGITAVVRCYPLAQQPPSPPKKVHNRRGGLPMVHVLLDFLSDRKKKRHHIPVREKEETTKRQNDKQTVDFLHTPSLCVGGRDRKEGGHVTLLRGFM